MVCCRNMTFIILSSLYLKYVFISIDANDNFIVQKSIICLPWIHYDTLSASLIELGHETFLEIFMNDLMLDMNGFIEEKWSPVPLSCWDTSAPWPQVDKFKCQTIHWLVLKQLTLGFGFFENDTTWWHADQK